ncbi:MAG: YhcH/YjgK/YiaL family protein [Brevinema sp.]
MIFSNVNQLQSKDFSGNMAKAVDFLKNNYQKILTQEVGKYEVCPEFFYLIQEYMPKTDNIWEAHEKYIDIQLVLDGEELLYAADRSHLRVLEPYNPNKDLITFEGEALITSVLKSGDAAIYFPTDAHIPGLKSPSYAGNIRKCVVKISI